MKKIIISACFTLELVVALMLPCQSAWAVSMNFNGHFRSEASYYSNAGLGLAETESTKSFLSGRGLLQPNLIIDDHFSLRSQWSVLTSPKLTPDGTVPLGVGQGGWVFGDQQSAALTLSRAWLEWTSDFGVVRLGRMPVSWGYGLLYDAGSGVWDDFQSTLDRLEYRLHLGHIVGALAYSKGRKLNVLGNVNDQEFYTVYLQYDNPETEVEGGILFEKQNRSRGQVADYLGTANPAPAVSPSPYALPSGYQGKKALKLATKTPFPLTNNVVDVYVKKTMGYLTLGGEVTWLSGEAMNYNGNGVTDSLNAFGAMVSASYEYHTVKIFLDMLYASGDSNLNGDHLNGFVLLHRNRRPGLILGRELLGQYYGNGVGLGSLVVYGNDDTFSGVFYARPGLRVDWSSAWSSGLEVIVAQKAQVATGEEKNLGVEIDAGTEYAVYKNFDLGVNVGYLIPGLGLGVPNPRGVFATRATAALRF